MPEMYLFSAATNRAGVVDSVRDHRVTGNEPRKFLDKCDPRVEAKIAKEASHRKKFRLTFARLMARARSNNHKTNSANIGFEAKLWLAADKLRSNMDAAEYKHVVLGLIFLKYISDSFEEHHTKLIAAEGEYAGAN